MERTCVSDTEWLPQQSQSVDRFQPSLVLNWIIFNDVFCKYNHNIVLLSQDIRVTNIATVRCKLSEFTRLKCLLSDILLCSKIVFILATEGMDPRETFYSTGFSCDHFMLVKRFASIPTTCSVHPILTMTELVHCNMWCRAFQLHVIFYLQSCVCATCNQPRSFREFSRVLSGSSVASS